MTCQRNRIKSVESFFKTCLLLEVIAKTCPSADKSIGAWRAKREIVSFRVVRACARCLCEVRSGWKSLCGDFPFSLFGPGGFPFSLCPPRSYPASAGFIGTFLYHGVFSDTIIHNILQYTRNEYKGYTLRYCTALYDTIVYHHLLYYTVLL